MQLAERPLVAVSEHSNRPEAAGRVTEDGHYRRFIGTDTMWRLSVTPKSLTLTTYSPDAPGGSTGRQF
jgi:hypothetical protein